jgi:hypothetical protein
MMTNEQETKMFGETVEEMLKNKKDYLGNSEYAMMILSDAKSVLKSFEDKERARQYINKAKYFIHLDMVQDRELQDWMSKANSLISSGKR